MEDQESGDLEVRYRSFRARRVAVIVALLAGIAVSTGVALSINGFEGVGFADCYGYIFGHLFGTTYPRGTDEWAVDYMLWNMYFPRVLMAIVAGAALAACGVAMQSLMNNPLADPYTVGISDGACFGAVAAIVMGFGTSTLLGSAGLVTSAFFCGLVPALILIFLARAVNLTPATSILIGVALSYIFSGLESALMVTTDADTLKTAYLWQIGSLNGISWSDMVLPFAITVVCSIFLIFCSGKLNLLSLGDDSAVSLGLDVDNFRTVTMVVVSVTVASIVSFCGIIGFVGLVAPHIMRMIVGGDNKYLIPSSMICGALFIQVADIISRTLVYPDELRVGLIISIIGAPVFLYIILRRKKNYGEALRWPGPSSRPHISAHAGATTSYPSPCSPSPAR